MLHINTCTKQELAMINTIASTCNVPAKKVVQFMNCFGVNNDRYQLIWGWVNDSNVKLKFKNFKSLLRNIKVRRLEDWVKPNGNPLFNTDKSIYIEDYIELA